MMDADGRVAVVMITYNRAAETLRSLEHLAALAERPAIVLVDNGSTDDTAACVAARFPSVEIVRLESNLGASARNLGVERARAEYVAFCDDDTWWAPGSLRRAADLLDAHPRVAVLCARVLVGPEEAEDPVCREIEASPLRLGEGLPGLPLLGFLAGASVVRRSAFLEAGGFEPRLFLGGEEEWLAADLAAASWHLRYVPELVSHHHPSNLRDAPRRRSTQVRNALWFAWARRPLPSALRRTLQIARREPLDRVTLRGFASALAGLPWAIRRRRPVPPEIEHALRLLEAPPAAVDYPAATVG